MSKKDSDLYCNFKVTFIRIVATRIWKQTNKQTNPKTKQKIPDTTERNGGEHGTRNLKKKVTVAQHTFRLELPGCQEKEET